MPEKIALIGFGSIGISFAALYLRETNHTISVFDPRPDLASHIKSVMPGYLETSKTGLEINAIIESGRLQICSELETAVHDATIVQEQGPESVAFKHGTWMKVLELAAPTTHLWSSTSGIPASEQVAGLPESGRQRVTIVHPYNPPHVMPLIEIVPSPETLAGEVEFAKAFFSALPSGHVPVVIMKEVPGFVGNRLQIVLFREAAYLVNEGVVSVEDLDKVMENSLGPRWAVTGPFKALNFGGGAKGLGGILKLLASTAEAVADDLGDLRYTGTSYEPGGNGIAKEGVVDWPANVVEKTKEAYGLPTPEQCDERDRQLYSVLAAKRA